MEGLHKSQIFLIFCAFFICGIFINSVWQGLIIYISVFCGLMFLAGIFFIKNKIYKILFISFIFLFLGCLRLYLSIPNVNRNFISFYNSQYVNFIGVISEEPDIRQDHVKLTVSAEEILSKNDKISVKGKVLVKTERFPKYNYGDVLNISCKLIEPGEIKDFDYGKYLSRYNIYSTCYNPKIKILSNKANFFYQNFYKFKNFLIQRQNLLLQEPQCSLLAGILFGLRKGIDKDLMNAFNITGTTHIIAVSGYNISIIALILINLCKTLYIPKKYSFWLCLAGISIFAFFTGASASVVRSAVIGIIVLIARQSARTSKILNVMVLAATLMLLFNPKILVFDVGFQLSFLSTLGLVYFTPILQKILFFLPEKFGLKGSLATTLSAIIFTAPIILFNFNRLSIIAPLTNILILPAIPISMLIGFIGILLGLINISAGQIFSWLSYLCLSYIIKVVLFMSALPFVSIEIKSFGYSYLILYIFIIIFIIWAANRKGIVKILNKL